MIWSYLGYPFQLLRTQGVVTTPQASVSLSVCHRVSKSCLKYVRIEWDLACQLLSIVRATFTKCYDLYLVDSSPYLLYIVHYQMKCDLNYKNLSRWKTQHLQLWRGHEPTGHCICLAYVSVVTGGDDKLNLNINLLHFTTPTQLANLSFSWNWVIYLQWAQIEDAAG
jgi:hypothetical protein